MGDTDLDSSSGNDGGSVKDDPSLYGRFWGLMTKEQMTETVLRYGVPHEFVCKLPHDIECISYLGPMEVAVVRRRLKLNFISHFTLLLSDYWVGTGWCQ